MTNSDQLMLAAIKAQVSFKINGREVAVDEETVRLRSHIDQLRDFFNAEEARDLLSEVVSLKEEDAVDFVTVPQFGAVQPGDLRYKDQDGDGIIDETDIVKIGNPAYPTTTVSIGADFSFRGFDLSLLITGNMGGTVNLMDYSAWKPFENYGNAFEWAKGAWVYYPEAKLDNRANATFPRLSAQQNDNNYRSSSFWIHSNNYLRLRNVELGYDFATLSAVRKAKISKLRVFLTAYNMFTLSSVLREFNMDPETADYGYPAAKSCNLGVQISF